MSPAAHNLFSNRYADIRYSEAKKNIFGFRKPVLDVFLPETVQIPPIYF